ncbi:MAG: methyltransferase domain-containing protein, partial [Candidatus Rokuibacteriota bacterium]
MDPAYVAVHLEEDRSHWWFRGRLAVIRATLRRALPPRRVRLLELGCGSGNVLAALAEFGEAVGMDAHEDLAAAARAAGLDVRLGHLPDDLGVAPGWAEVVLLLDVIEHVDDD